VNGRSDSRDGRLRGARRHPRYALCALALALPAAAAPAAASAQDPLPGNNSGTGQYVEPVPDAGGDRPAAPGTGPGRTTLPAGTRARLPAGAEGRTLERLATDPGSGAPAGATQGGRAGDGGHAGSAAGGPSARILGQSDQSAFRAATEASAGGDGHTVPLLIVALIALTLGVGAAARSRGRSS
jgi:hypothetical protein